MRLVKAKVPEGLGDTVAQIALDAGVSQVGLYTQEVLSKDGKRERKQVVDVATATPVARRYVDALTSAPFFDPKEISFEIRDARTIVSSDGADSLTRPVVESAPEVAEELWQFTHVTPSFVVRVIAAASLLAFGMIHEKTLLMAAGLLFLPYLPVLLGIGFGAITRQWQLVARSLVALVVETALAVGTGAAVALATHGPMKHADFSPLLTGLIFSVIIGVAAGFATTDDVGWRQLIGLAAASQMAFVPIWLGIALVYGFADNGTVAPSERLLTFAVNAFTIVVTSATTYTLLGMTRHSFHWITGKGSTQQPFEVAPGPGATQRAVAA